MSTSRDRRPKSAPYLRLKIAKGLQNVKVLMNWGPFMGKKTEKSFTMPKKTEREAFWDFSTFILSQNSKKIKGEPFGGKIFEKSRTMPKKTEREALWDFSTFILSQNSKKN